MQSTLEKRFRWFWQALKGPDLAVEFKFHPKRKWRADFCHLPSKTLIEIEGGEWSGGRHTRGSGFIDDCEKYNEAVYAGFRVIRLTGTMLTTPNIERLIKALG